MKLIKKLSLVAMLFVAVLSLASCVNLEKYADKITKAAEKDEHITYSEVMDKLGDEVIDYTADIPVLGRGGIIIKVKGCANWEEVQAKLDEGKTVKGIIITIAGGKATNAEYREITADDAK